MDFDGDGRTDIVSGSWPGEVYFFQRKPDGSFAEAQLLKDREGELIKAGSASTAFVVDWDSDGDLDLLLGSIAGTVFLVQNASGGRGWQFEKPRVMTEVDASEFGDSHPVAADWDDDGRLDLLLGHSEGGVLWYRNEGTATKPQLAKPVEVIPHSPSPWKSDNQRRPGDWGLRAKICVTDWNRDGRLDILLGDRCGGFTAKATQTKDEEVAANRAKRDLPLLRQAWAKAYRSYRSQAAAPKGEGTDSRQRDAQLAALRQEMKRLKKQIADVQMIRSEYKTQQQTHGFVWLFTRKP